MSFVRSISEDVEDVVSSAVASVGDSVALQVGDEERAVSGVRGRVVGVEGPFF